MAILGRGITGLVLPPGSILVGSDEGVVDELLIGAPGQVLTIVDNPTVGAPDSVQWQDPEGSGSGGTITGGQSLAGVGAEVYAAVNGTLLTFRRIAAGDNINVVQNANDITISAEDPPVTSVNGLTGAVSLDLAELNDVDISGATSGQFLSYNGTDWVPATPPSGGDGEDNDGTNVGTGSGIYAGKVGITLQFRSLVAGDGISIAQNGNEIEITNTAPDDGGAGGLTSVGLTSPNGTMAIAGSPLIANGTLNIDLPSIADVIGTYVTPSNITVDNYGRITAIEEGTTVNTNKWLTFEAKDATNASASTDTDTFVFSGTDINTSITGTTMNFNLANVVGLTPGSYTRANITVDAKGRVITATDGTLPNGYSSLVTDSGTASAATSAASAGIKGEQGVTTLVESNEVKIRLTDTSVTPGTYGGSTGTAAQFTVDAKGRITAAQSKSVLQSLSNDLNPTLGGNLDVVSYDIRTTATNGNIVLTPNGTGSVSVSNAKIINLATPTASTDAATKAYVDSVAGIGAAELGDLTDVVLTSPVDGQYLKYDGTQWINDVVASALGDLSDVDFSTPPATDEYLRYNGTTWVSSGLVIGAINLNDLADVVITTATTGEILAYDGTQWANSSVNLLADVTTDSGTASVTAGILSVVGGNGISTSGTGNEVTIQNTKTALALLDDIDFSTPPVDDQFIRYDETNSNWVPYTLPAYALNSITTIDTGTSGSSAGTINAGTNSTAINIFGANGITTSASGSTITISQSLAIDDLSNIAITAPSDGEILYYDNDSSTWVNGAIQVALNDLTDVDSGSLANGHILVYNTTSSNWVAVASSAIDQNIYSSVSGNTGSSSAGTPTTDLSIQGALGSGITTSVASNVVSIDLDIGLGDLNNVDNTAPTDGQMLVYDIGTSMWIPTSLSANSLGGLSDVTLTTPINEDFLMYNGTSWINKAIGTIDSIATDSGTLNVTTIETDISILGGNGLSSSLAGNVITLAITGGIDTLTDVDTTTTPPSGGDTLVWSAVDSAWIPNSVGVFNLESDTTPKLGGDLDVTGFEIKSDIDTDVSINPGGTGKINLADMLFSKLEDFTADNLGTAAIFLTYAASFEYTVIEYHYTSSTGKRIGSLLILNDGTDTSVVDTGTELGTPDVVFSAAINATDVEVTVTPEADAVLTYHVRQLNL